LLLWIVAMATESMQIRWTGEFVFALAWLVVVMTGVLVVNLSAAGLGLGRQPAALDRNAS
jgi:hypothetical protein